jgi:hypothetical protein
MNKLALTATRVKERDKYLLEVIPQLYGWCRSKHPVITHYRLPMVKRVYIALDEKQIGATFDR